MLRVGAHPRDSFDETTWTNPLLSVIFLSYSLNEALEMGHLMLTDLETGLALEGIGAKKTCDEIIYVSHGKSCLRWGTHNQYAFKQRPYTTCRHTMHRNVT